ncbi:DgyrCDS9902 [Dimorphilus gyrociliatus]|uniref:DgyrCDS9902 n=1 Tax=Dimorphilus gyrociliatus TaxID=2664684 RepID=A0A7I8W3P5_9ANNE|nr:DgyrCDS9902 [Dimorphilus gyrociliatus]
MDRNARWTIEHSSDKPRQTGSYRVRNEEIVKETRTVKRVYQLQPSNKRNATIIQLSYVGDDIFYILFQGRDQSEIVKYNSRNLSKSIPVYREPRLIFGFAIDHQQQYIYLSNRYEGAVQIWTMKKRHHMPNLEIRLNQLGRFVSQLKLINNRLLLCLETDGALILSKQDSNENARPDWKIEWNSKTEGSKIISADLLNEEVILLCDENKQSVFMINWRDDCILRRINQLIDPIEIISFPDDETFIVCNESYRLDMYDKNGNYMKNLLIPLPYAPHRIAFNNDGNQLIFIYGKTNKMLGIF